MPSNFLGLELIEKGIQSFRGPRLEAEAVDMLIDRFSRPE
jgi:hypothetical protein